MVSNFFDPAKFFLGNPCPKGCRWFNTGKTLRRITGNKCDQCQKKRGKKWHEDHRELTLSRSKTRRKAEAVSGIYMIKNIVNGKVYVGSSVSMFHRWKTHRNDLDNKKHSSPHLQSAWDKYGESSFSFEVLEYVLPDPDMLVMFEGHWIKKLNSFDRKNGYNTVKIPSKPDYAIGSNHHFAKLKESDIVDICNLFSNGKTQIEIAEMYGVTKGTIYSIVTGKTWKHVDRPLIPAGLIKECPKRQKPQLSKKEVEEIKKKVNNGVPFESLMQEYDVTRVLIRDIVQGKTWKNVLPDIALDKTQIKHPKKLNPTDVVDIRERLAVGESDGSIAKSYKMSIYAISSIRKGVTWSHVKEGAYIDPSPRVHRNRIPKEKLEAIEARLAEGVALVRIQKEFGIAASTVSRINKNLREKLNSGL